MCLAPLYSSLNRRAAPRSSLGSLLVRVGPCLFGGALVLTAEHDRMGDILFLRARYGDVSRQWEG